jgi:hypothetical protein
VYDANGVRLNTREIRYGIISIITWHLQQGQGGEVVICS